MTPEFREFSFDDEGNLDDDFDDDPEFGEDELPLDDDDDDELAPSFLR